MLLVFVVFELCHGLYPDQVLLSLVGGPSIFFFSFLAPELECLCLCLLSKVLLCSLSSTCLVLLCRSLPPSFRGGGPVEPEMSLVPLSPRTPPHASPATGVSWNVPLPPWNHVGGVRLLHGSSLLRRYFPAPDRSERLYFHFSLFTFMCWRRKWQPTPVFLPGESQGRWSLMGCHLWGRTESETTERLSSSSSSSLPLWPGSRRISSCPSAAEAQGRAWAFGRPALWRTETATRPRDFRAGCREPPGGRFYNVPPLRSFR